MANEIKVERCDGTAVPKRWKVSFEGKQAGWVEELIIPTIFGNPEYIGLYFCDEPGVKLVPKTFGGQTGQQLAIAAVIEHWQADRAEQYQREVEDFGGGQTG